MKNSQKFLVMTACLLTTLALAFSQPLDAADGRQLTKSKCKTCHVQGSDGGTMTPLSKTQRQWERFFKKDRHEKKAPGTWQDISKDELELIRQYLIDHAADSPHPETCG